MSSSSVIICSTARLVRGVLIQYQQSQLAAGVQQWQAFDACTLQQWLARLLDDASLLGLLPSVALPVITLSPVAEAYLWEQAIASCLEKHEAAALFDIRALAKSAIEANQLLCDWQIDESAINHHFISQETRQFLRWRHTFQSLCVQKNAIEPARLKRLQIELLEKHALSLPNSIVLAGFDRITPLENRLFAYLKTQGVQLEPMVSAENQAQVSYFPLQDVHAECRAAVAWAQQKLLKNPQAQLAIISPALGNVRRELADLLDDTFHPETLKSSHFEAPRCYDFSLGLALTEYPIVQSALRLLRLASVKTDMNFDEVTPVLQDIYWGGAAELDARALFDAHLRQCLSASYGLDVLLSQAKKLQAEGRLALTVLIEHVAILIEFQSQSHARQLPSAWVVAFLSLLDTLNWANGQGCLNRDLSSHEYQAQQAFFKCLKELGELDSILGKTTLSEVVQKLTELCSEAMFQPESRGDTHIQLLGLLETPAVQLDAVWALNMNDQHWPPPVKLNPLLPAELQRSQGTPNASTRLQNAFATLVQQRLLMSAPEIVFSYALKEDERELRPSPLLAIESAPIMDVGLQNSAIDTIQTLAERLAQPAVMLMLDDSMAPAIVEGEKVRGGVKLFATQAVCPAWAFYQYRLGANKLETPVDGLDNMARGSLLHKVLQYFWLDCGNLSKLLAMDQAQRLAAIDIAIKKSLQALHDEMRGISPQVLQIEQQRLRDLLQYWLEIESARADFSVADCEQVQVLDIEGLTVKLTIDRIDKLADGSMVVIDYKTSSSVTNKSWADARIAEPQLPIYAVLALKYEPVTAVCFAKIRTDEAKFIGLTADEGVLPEVAALTALKASSSFKRFADWDSLMEHWYVSLTSIAQEIKAGVASVSFTNENDLAYCDIKPLLRLPERTLQFERMQAVMSDALLVKKP